MVCFAIYSRPHYLLGIALRLVHGSRVNKNKSSSYKRDHTNTTVSSLFYYVHHMSTVSHKIRPRIETLVAHCDQQESSWLCGNALASDANGPGSTPGGAHELDTGYHPFVGR